MCGLVGFVGRGDRDQLEAMTRCLSHRGPDGEGFFVDESARVFLGHRRLAVIDLPGGQQPMWNETFDVCVVFNGEIYNHGELRRELTDSGHVFRSDHSDTEVLVHGYEEWGDELPRRLNGMFAFAVYDQRRGRLFLARDHFGKKPLYYSHHNGSFAFASELSALARHASFEPSIQKRALQKLFAYGFLPSPHTLYRDTFKLPGGCLLTYDVQDGTLRKRRYWQFRIDPHDEATLKREEDLAEELSCLLLQAVRRRLISDVPLGIFLSGGIDSSCILAMAAKSLPPSEIKSFTVGFDEPSYDESAYAQEVAEHLQVAHHLETCDLSKALDLSPTLLSQLDEPLGDSSLLPTYLLSRFTRRHVTVALSGDGGDELFAGYDPFKALTVASIYDRLIPRVAHHGLRRLVDLLPHSDQNMSLDFKLRRILAGLSYPRGMWNPVWLGPLEPRDIADMLHDPVDAEDLYCEALELWRSSESSNLVDRTLDFYTNLYLQDNILTKVDRASMMVALEVRAPFLDNDVVEFARRLPHGYKYRRGERKYLLKRALLGMLPGTVLKRGKKGFGMPLAKWLRAVPVTELTHSTAGIDPGWVRRQWAEHQEGKADRRLFLWCWLSLCHHLQAMSPREVLSVGG
jgi:asparagine synthase (glutamine-hydrolysing)